MSQDAENLHIRSNKGVAYILFLASVEARGVQELMAAIAARVPNGTHTLYLILCTAGGAVSQGIAAYHLLRALPYKIIAHNIGNVDSIGNVMFMAASERYATTNATFMLHRVKSQAADERMELGALKEKMSSIQADEKRIADILVEHTKLTAEEINALFVSGDATKDTAYALDKQMIHAVRELRIPDAGQLLIVHAD